MSPEGWTRRHYNMIMPTLTGDYDAGGGLREKEKKIERDRRA